ncbi:hypothetical protein BDV27DRAFT_53793 [Aspergillus caelatus]|uniref:GPI anchored protein n=2 Tax=Aspergillus subgen. Circumdati TaxID=2720871 RepID=A0A5N6ZPD9_9EURO|nr:uncharacterized protein BDV27DRAFT_53793 [Aspergillus caelatus]KAE8359487.1 hypothetical protein BDV27DRAFT_53793 [Aspergillus caelatus]KAE8412126.1 hypothetical protein BDV36DRAFT_301193 [Aspergillus pseudocaelatus]
MRFSVAAVFAAVAAGVVAEEVSTVIVTETATYCPKSTDAIGVSPTESISIPAGYTTTRPLITSTVTECNKCSSTAPPAGTPTGVNPVGSSTPSSPVIPVVPSVPSSSKATPSSSSSVIKRPSSSSIVISSTPLVHSTQPASTNAPPAPSASAPSASGPSDVSPTGSATTPAVPLFTSGGSRAAVGAGAGLATVFGLAAVLL